MRNNRTWHIENKLIVVVLNRLKNNAIKIVEIVHNNKQFVNSIL